MYHKTSDFLRNPFLLLISLGHRGWFNWMSDETYLRMVFRIKMRKRLNLENPQTYNEKLQWIKLYDRQPQYTKMVDKYEVKKYVADVIGEEYIIPTLGVWDKADDIDLDKLPNQFVLKCTHDSGGNVICSDKSKLNIQKVRKRLNSCLKNNSFWGSREWPYKNVKPRIIAEKYLTNGNSDLIDYKVHCFEGKPRFILVCQGRFSKTGLTEDFYSVNWELMDISRPQLQHAIQPIKRPTELEEMLFLSQKLSTDIHFLRVDFYIVDGKVFLGELTFFPASGLKPFVPEEKDSLFGGWINLPKHNY